MRQFDVGVADACGFRNGEDLFEMQGLSGIYKVQHAICFEIANASSQARKVRCGVQIAAVGFLHYDRQYFAFLILELVQKYFNKLLKTPVNKIINVKINLPSTLSIFSPRTASK